jgi:hypothetical protein
MSEAPSNRGGRPPKSETERRSRWITIRVTDAQAERLDQLAEHFGCSRTQLLRGWVQRLVSYKGPERRRQP